MNLLKEFVKKYFKHFAYFYRYLRYRVFINMLLSIGVGVLDGFGLAMFIPLLQMVDGQSEAGAEGMGGFSFLITIFQQFGIPLTLVSVLMIIAVFFLLKGVVSFVSAYYKAYVLQFFIRKLRYQNIDALSSYAYKHFVNADSGRIQNTLSGEVGRVTTAYNTYFATLQSGVMVTVYLTFAMISNLQFAILVAIGGFLTNLLYRQIYNRTKKQSLKVTHEGHIFQGQLIQKVAFFKYLKATGFMSQFDRMIKRTIDNLVKANLKIGFYNSLLAASREPLVILVVVIVILVQVKFLGGSLSGILLSLLFFYRSLTYLVGLQNSWNGFLNVSGSLSNMQTFMEELKKGKEEQGAETFNKFTKEIVLHDVGFYYGSDPILSDINLTIDRNKTVAFVGESGSGKTTLVNLIAGLMPVDTGTISIDGIPYSRLNRESLQKRIGYITQDPVIFSDTVYNNVTLWAPKTPENVQRFWGALEKSALADFIRNQRKKEDTPLGNNGIQVSGGQKQRISIARELFKDIDILIMDEATSALDSETEKAIQENIDALKGQYTILIVAHRLSTIKNADLIVFMMGGKIHSKGKYEDLREKSGYFRKMTELQEL